MKVAKLLSFVVPFIVTMLSSSLLLLLLLLLYQNESPFDESGTDDVKLFCRAKLAKNFTQFLWYSIGY